MTLQRVKQSSISEVDTQVSPQDKTIEEVSIAANADDEKCQTKVLKFRDLVSFNHSNSQSNEPGKHLNKNPSIYARKKKLQDLLSGLTNLQNRRDTKATSTV